MPENSETVTGNPAQQPNSDDQKDNTHSNGTDNQNSEVQVSIETDSQPTVEACILKSNITSENQNEPEETHRTETSSSDQACSLRTGPKSPEVIATEAFLLNEKSSPESAPSQPNEEPPKETSISQVPEPEPLPTEPRTPANSEASEPGLPQSNDELVLESQPAQIVEVEYTETIVVEPIEEPSAPVEEPTTINGDLSEEQPKESLPDAPKQESALQVELTNGQSNGECKLEPRKVPEPEPHRNEKSSGLIETIANELIAEDYKLPDVVEVKKHFEYVQPAQNGVSATPPKKGALSTRLDSKSVKQAYEDVRFDGSETQWAVFKFEGPTIVTSATGSDFTQFKSHFGDDERAFGYIRVQTGDELSKRAKFLLITWVGPSVSVLKRAKMSTDKALMKEILSNFAVELQTENISDINLQNFETELDKAAGAHYGTGVRG